MFKQEGYDLMGAAFEVYNELGYGMAEEIYQAALEVELGLRGIRFTAQAELDVFFKGHLLTPKYRPDLLVFGEIVIELKALKELCTEHDAQLFNYMRIARKHVGYLINFGKKGELEWKRFVVDDLHVRTKGSNWEHESSLIEH
jgi:GxxExxY protein